MENWLSSKLKAAESLLQQIDQQAAESLGKNDRSQSETVNNDLPRKSETVSLKAQLKKKSTEKKLDNLPKINLEKSIRKKRSESSPQRTNCSPVSSNQTTNDEDWTELLGSSKSSPASGKTNGVSDRYIVNGNKRSPNHRLNRNDSSVGSGSKQTPNDLALLEAKKTHTRSVLSSKPVKVFDVQSTNKLENNVSGTHFGKQGDGLLTSAEEVLAKMDVEFQKPINLSPRVSDAFGSSERRFVNDNQKTLDHLAMPRKFYIAGADNSPTYSRKESRGVSQALEANGTSDYDNVHKPSSGEKVMNQGGFSHDQGVSSLGVGSDDLGVDSQIPSEKSITNELRIKEGTQVSYAEERDALASGVSDINNQENGVDPAFMAGRGTSDLSAGHHKLQQLHRDSLVSPSLSTQKLDSVPVGSSESEDGSSSETELGSTSDSEDEHISKREERKRKEQMIAEAAAARAVEAIREHENIVARLEREKQSLEKILEEREKQQAQEASMMQTNMEEVIKAVEQEKQKHNNTRMEAMACLAKLETTNAELARSLASTQWKLEKEVSQVTQLRQEIDLKELAQEDLRNRISAIQKNISSLNQLDGFSGTEFQREIAEAECVVISDKIKRLHDKEKMLEENITTRTMLEDPTDLELELKRRLAQLTDHLIHKQAQVEALTSEKSTLLFRLETLAEDQEMRMQSVDFTSNSGSWLDLVGKNDIELGAWGPANAKGHFFREEIESGMQHIVSIIRQLDSIFATGVVFLRRNWTAQACALLYLVCLHAWVLYILFSGDSVDNRSGAVLSLESINKTSSF